MRYAREPIFQGKPRGYDASLDNVFLEEGDEHAALASVWAAGLNLKTRFQKRWVYGESSPIVRRIPLLPARMLVKEVNASLSLAWLQRKFGFRIALTLRHPCGFWASALKLREIGHHTLNLDGLLEQERLMATYFSSQDAWLRSLVADDERLLAAYCMIIRVVEQQSQRRPDWVICRHEDLCADPVREFQRIFSALGFPFTARAHRFIDVSSRESGDGIYNVFRNSALETDKWRRGLSTEQLQRAEQIIGRFDLESYSASSVHSA